MTIVGRDHTELEMGRTEVGKLTRIVARSVGLRKSRHARLSLIWRPPSGTVLASELDASQGRGRRAKDRPMTRLQSLAQAGLLTTLLVASVGCAGLSRRLKTDDVVFARQIAQRGMDAVDAGNWNRAEEYFAKAVEACPVDERVQARYAESLWRRGAREDALQHMTEAVRLSGGDPELVVRLGEMQLDVGDLQQAGDLAERVIQSGRQQASAFKLRGAVRERQGQWQEALADYHRALAIEPNCADVQMAVATVYLQQGRPQRALSTLQALASSCPSGEEPGDMLYLEGLACEALGRHAQAATHLQQAVERGIDSPNLYFNLAQAHYALGDQEAADLALQRTLEADPTHAAALHLADAIRQSRQVASLRR
jgi:tetratricopeptide (TPR) repeat protein